jgi:uncharacterized protein Yka (UPF0111/DUF47 family)
VKRGRWFLPETPDVLGLLRGQMAVTNEALSGFAAWAKGDPQAAATVRDAEPRGDEAKRALLESLRDSFVTPIEPEDLFALSRAIDWILNYARDLIEEAEVMKAEPDSAIAEMADLLRDAGGHLEAAIRWLGEDGVAATAEADAAIKAERRLEHVYYTGMARLLEVDERHERISHRELYRRCARIGEIVIDVAERTVYAVVKES